MTTKQLPATVFYDGACPLCRSEMGVLMRDNQAGRLRFVDISGPGFDATARSVAARPGGGKRHVVFVAVKASPIRRGSSAP